MAAVEDGALRTLRPVEDVATVPAAGEAAETGAERQSAIRQAAVRAVRRFFMLLPQNWICGVPQVHSNTDRGRLEGAKFWEKSGFPRVFADYSESPAILPKFFRGTA